MGDIERQQMERRIILQRWGLIIAGVALTTSLLASWGGLPSRVDRLEECTIEVKARTDKHSDVLLEIREKLARIEASNEEIKRRIDRAHPTQ